MAEELSQIDIDNVRQWMPWYLRKYHEGEHTSLMSLLEDGVYRRLLDAMWMTQTPVGTMPQDDRQIAALAKVSKATWKKVREQVLKSFIDGGDGRWHQPDQIQVWKEQCAKYTQSRERARAGGKAKAAKALLKQCPSNAQAMPTTLLKHCLAPADAPLAPDSLKREGTPPVGGGASSPPTPPPPPVETNEQRKAQWWASKGKKAGGAE